MGRDVSSPERQVPRVEQLDLDLLGLATKHAVGVPGCHRSAVPTDHLDRELAVDDVEHEPCRTNREAQHSLVTTSTRAFVVVPALPLTDDEAAPVTSTVVVNDEVTRQDSSDPSEDVSIAGSEPVEVLRERHVDVEVEVLGDELRDAAGHDDSLKMEDVGSEDPRMGEACSPNASNITSRRTSDRYYREEIALRLGA